MLGQCILCLNDGVALTSEHIFPESTGGKICKNILCQSCNSNLGRFVDAPYLNQFVVQLARYANRLEGKTGRIPQPFSDSYSVILEGEKEIKFKFDANFKPQIISSAPEILLDENGEVVISVVVDGAKSAELPAMIKKALSRFFKTREGIALGLSDEEQEKTIEDEILKAGNVKSKTSPVGNIQGRHAVEYKKIYLEYVKVLYEICCIEFEGFRESNSATLMRDFLIQQFSNSPLHWDFEDMAIKLGISFDTKIANWLPVFKPLICEKSLDSLHIAVIHSNFLICSMLGFGCAFMKVDKQLINDVEQVGRVYLNEIDKGGKAGIFSYHEIMALKEI